MSAEDLLTLIQRRPFEPFRVYLTNGNHYDVMHPEMVVPARRTVAIGFDADPAKPLIADRIATVALLHIVRIEPIDAAAPA